MARDRSLLEREMQRLELRPFTLEGFHRRRERRQRNRRIRAGVVALLVAAAGAAPLVRAFSSGPVPAGDPRSPFLGTWVSTDTDGSTQRMTIGASGNDAVEIVVHDDSASVCSGAPSTMTGTGRLVGTTGLVIPSPLLTCDDGSDAQALSGPPLEEQLRNLTFVHDPQADTLTDNLGLVWAREGAENPGPAPTMSGRMWPQSSLEEIREAQQLADAGDPRYTWQVDPELAANLDDAEILARFLREELRWEAFLWNPYGGSGGEGILQGDKPWLISITGIEFIRCTPGRTNPLYPDDPVAGGCAPTIDEFQYETVQISVAQLGRRGPSGIWVVTGWQMLPPFEQVTPLSDAQVTELMNAFLEARVAGEGAEEHAPTAEEEIPLLYATTTGAPYERYEFELVAGPEWPDGARVFKVRLFAEGGKTVVEQHFRLEGEAPGPVDLDLEFGYGPDGSTTENGQPVAELYSILDGEVTYSADSRWEGGNYGAWALWLDDNPEERFHVLADAHPIEFRGDTVDVQSGIDGCQPGPAVADADALARSIRSDPDLEATEPVTVAVGGIEALRMDVAATPGANLCGGFLEGAGVVVETAESEVQDPVVVGAGHRMRLYLIDLPGGSARILAIAIVAPKDRFERVLEAAAPIVESFEFHTE